ncbi:MAG: ABC-type transport auxiliary lipoprotein family protein [Gammaproteobacteria bacterium]
MSRFALLSIVLLAAAGCSGGLHSDGPAMQIYVLRAASTASSTADAKTAAAASTLQLPRPSADPGLSTELITLVRTDRRMDYFSGSRWAAQLPDIVETLAIDTLRASGAWSAVHESPSPFVSEYVLQIDIRRFEADYTEGGEAPKVHVVLDCTLARRVGRELVTNFVAEGVAQASENRMGPVVAAFEKAATEALATLADRSAVALRTASASEGR